jgi:heme exporter protein C
MGSSTRIFTTYGRGLRGLSLATVATISLAFALVFFYAPLDADQGFVQKIFYIHVPLAIVSLCGFVLGGLFAVGHLRSGDRRWDMRAYVAIHMALIFSVGALITGSIWAKASWGHWWVWNEPTLVSFLIVVLMFATYQPLRFSIEDPERQARYASVFAIVAGAFVPLNFIAVRLAQGFVHPRVLTLGGGNLPGSMRLTFLVSLIGIALLYATLWKYEMAAKNARMQTRRLRRMLLGEDAVAPLRRSAAPS